MIAIVDGGSTKCDWYITNADYSQHFEIQNDRLQSQPHK